MKSERAFTLIELLMAIAIIGIVAALLLPTLHRARNTARSLTCLNNLKQWAFAAQLYAGENGDWLPADGTPNALTNAGWYAELPRVLRIPTYFEMPWRTNAAIEPGRCLWICPSNSRRSNGRNLFHYCLNEHINGTGTGNHARLSSLRHPARLVWIFDNGGLAAVAQQNNVHTNLHSRGAQFSFLDGHAARFRNTEYWDFAANRGRTNNPSLLWMP